MRVMTTNFTPGKPTTRRYTKEEKDQAVRLVFELRRDLEHEPGHRGEDRRPVGYRTESLRSGLPRLKSMPEM